ncbi:MAG: class I SAM-dependent methyltransferase [Candidatus Omnitrophota bacterium]|nr:MAG: class I SAM-dependent methyltransferase [Candidatus Omnitrophota bacterium]
MRFLDAMESLEQDEEWCWVEYGGITKKIRFHDYDEVYKIPGLYEFLFYEKLECNSPRMVCSLLKKELDQSPTNPEDLVVLDVGAGNGMVGEELVRLGVEKVIGVDIIEEAGEAVERDRPAIYEEYLIEDLTELSPSGKKILEHRDLNCLTTVAALGFGDIPPLAFAEAFNLITAPGWIAFNIKERFIGNEDSSGFSRLIHEMTEEGIMNLRSFKRYQHRLSLAGTPLYYDAIVATKQKDIPREWIDAMNDENHTFRF